MRQTRPQKGLLSKIQPQSTQSKQKTTSDHFLTHAMSLDKINIKILTSQFFLSHYCIL